MFSNKLYATAYNSEYLYEKDLTAAPNTDSSYIFHFNDELSSGTYKLVFRLYDGTHLIEEEIEYLIVTKEVVNES